MQPVQLKMARAALDFSVDQLASTAGLSPLDIDRLEAGETDGSAFAGRLRSVFEDAGIEFIGDDAVRLRTPTAGTIALEDLNSENDE